MKIDDIKTLVNLMSEHDLSEIKIENNGDNLCIKRGGKVTQIQQLAPQVLTPAAAVAPAAAAPAAEKAASPAAEKPAAEETITSPLVGTFDRCPSPDAPSFVKIGDSVTPDTVVGIIEAMKVMNEIKAEKSGVIRECMVENGQAVEFGQVLFVIE